MIAPAHQALLISVGALIPPPIVDIAPAPIRADLLQPYPLRDYQLDLLLEAARLMRLGYKRILIQLPTGGGKTVLAAAMLGSATALSMRSQFIVHRKELINQTSVSFDRFDIPHGFVASGRPLDMGPSVTLSGVQTLVNRLDMILPPDLVVLDEAHHATATTWDRVLTEFEGRFVIGLTATPERLDGRGLDDHFDIMIQGPTVAELIADGYLSPFEYYAPSAPDLSGLRITAADYNRGDAATLMDKPTLIGNIVEHYLSLAKGQPGIGFAASREHSRNIVEAFRGNGVRAAHVDGSMSDKERERLDAAFRAGDLDLLSQVDLFGEGYDVPSAVYCGLWRPTKSRSLHKQQCGRVLRPAPGKVAIIADHVGNAVVNNLGLPDDEVQWTLEGRAGRARTGVNDDAMSIRQCLLCFRVSPSTVKVCPGCDTPFPAQVRQIREQEGRLIRLTAEERAARELEKKKQAALRKAEEKACKDYADFYHLAVARGYENPVGWAKMRQKFKHNYGR